ncbi:MAG TPA: hypothetical protein VKA09_12695 [Nitrososphaeraceae archaeon]|nr:hypothetical protein [Nitrososphaeraceae archaeon]
MSDNFLNQAQFNTVLVQQEKMDQVGFEPTTSAMPDCIFSDSGFENARMIAETAIKTNNRSLNI